LLKLLPFPFRTVADRPKVAVVASFVDDAAAVVAARTVADANFSVLLIDQFKRSLVFNEAAFFYGGVFG